MTLQETREELARYGRILATKGLVARTWGNLSLRLGDTMVITPSGIPYEDLGPGDMVQVSINDLTWDGPLKPSSEKALHGTVYRLCPDVQAIFHTHQNLASALAAARHQVPVEDADLQAALGPVVPCADYALPTTDPLAKAVGRVLAKGSIPAVLLANHGTVCTGTSTEGALAAAVALETLASRALVALAGLSVPPAVFGVTAALRATTDTAGGLVPVGTDPVAVAQHLATLGLLAGSLDLLIRSKGSFHLLAADGSLQPLQVPGQQGLTSLLHPSMLAPDSPHGAILLSRGPASVHLAGRGEPIRPLLDDLAQMCGTGVPLRNPRPGTLRLAPDSAVLVRGQGAVCAARNAYELAALAQVVEKSAVAQAAAGLLGKRHPISLPEVMLMRLIYLSKYSRTARKRTAETSND